MKSARTRDALPLLAFALAAWAIPLAGASLGEEGPTPGAGRAPGDRPNFVLILADDLGWGEVGCYGQERIRTPCLDRMAAEGARFTRFYAGAPVCAPSRCVLMTGLHLAHAPIRDNSEVQPEGQRPLPGGAVTLAEVLRERGYATACVGKWGLGFPGSEGDPLKQGFDRFYGFNCQRHAHDHYPTYLWRDGVKETVGAGPSGRPYAGDLFAEEALAFIRRSRDRPFFLYYASTVPHMAMQVPEDSLVEYRGKWPDPPYDGKKGYRAHPTPRAAYAAMVTRLDRDVGRILSVLGETGLDRNTLVIFTSDNGPTHDGIGGTDPEFFRSAGGLRGLKGSVLEGGLRVPLIARWPGAVPPGRAPDHVSASQDILPTLAEAAGAKTPPGIDGISFLPTLLGAGTQRAHESLVWDFEGYGGQQAVRAGRWKGVRTGAKREPSSALALYDLGGDPGEARDVAAGHPDVVARMEAVLAEARREQERRW